MRTRAARKPAHERRESLIEHASAVFAESGFDAARTSDVAQAAGVAPAAVYRYFPTKRDLYLATLRAAGPRLLALWKDAVVGSREPLETVRALGLGYFDHLEGRSQYARLWFQALGDVGDEEVRSTIAANLTAQVDAIAGIIGRGRADGTVAAGVDPRIAAWHFLAIGFAFDLIHHLGLDAELDRPRVEAWGDLFIDSLREQNSEQPPAQGRAMRVRQSRSTSVGERSGDPLPALPEGPHDPVEPGHTGGRSP